MLRYDVFPAHWRQDAAATTLFGSFAMSVCECDFVQ
jgi:hypothetical protein